MSVLVVAPPPLSAGVDLLDQRYDTILSHPLALGDLLYVCKMGSTNEQGLEQGEG